MINPDTLHVTSEGSVEFGSSLGEQQYANYLPPEVEDPGASLDLAHLEKVSCQHMLCLQGWLDALLCAVSRLWIPFDGINFVKYCFWTFFLVLKLMEILTDKNAYQNKTDLIEFLIS